MRDGFGEYYDVAVEPGKRERAYAWATAMFAITYLRSKGFDVTNDLFARESWYFRNALVRANYENTRLDVAKTTLYLEDFLKVLICGAQIELKNPRVRSRRLLFPTIIRKGSLNQ